jgi:glutamine amidotransferase
MCLLTFLPAGVLPDTAALFNGATVNNDGHGFAIVAGGQLIVHRGMHAEAIIEAFAAARRQHPHGPALFHSRFGTHGEAIIDNCHPFPVGGDGRTVLAHNGILPPVVQPAKDDPRSDTRIAAEDFIPTFGSLRTRRIRLRLQRWMSTHNKVVILTVDRRFKQRSYILNEQSGIWDGGIWYSNDGYLPTPPARWLAASNVDWDWPPCSRRRAGDWRGSNVERCPNCEAITDVFDGECGYCGWCLDCGEMPDQCFCYTPAALDQPTSTRADTSPTMQHRNATSARQHATPNGL